MKNDKDWDGNRCAIFSTLGASNHSKYERTEHDYYATEPVAIDMLRETGFFVGIRQVLEPAAGGGHLAERLKKIDGIDVEASDLYDYGYCDGGIDFLKMKSTDADAIVTNPPYKYALEFCKKCVELGVPKFAMFLKITFLEGQKRQEFFRQFPPRYVAVCVNRVRCARNADPDVFKESSAACYAWFIWEKGYKGNPEVLWVKK